MLDAPMLSQVNDDWDTLDASGEPVTPNWSGSGSRTRTFVQNRAGNVIAINDNGLQRQLVRVSYDQLGYPILDSEYVGADMDADGGLTGADIEAFFAAFEPGLQIADLDKDGGITGGDIEQFFTWFETGFTGDHDLNDQRFLYCVGGGATGGTTNSRCTTSATASSCEGGTRGG